MQRLHSVDYLKLTIALGVVWAHATLLTLNGEVFSYIFGQGLVRSVVPTFALVSGFLFHGTFHHGRARGWLGRLLVFYLVWLVIYAPLWLRKVETPADLAASVIFGPMHLWYMAALLVALLMILAIVTLVRHERRARWVLAGAALLCLLCGYTIQMVGFHNDLNLPMNLARNGVFLEFPYAAMGWLVADRLRRLGWDWLPRAGVLLAVFSVLVVLRLGEAALSLHLYGLSIYAAPEFPVLAVAFSMVTLLLALRVPLPKPPVNVAFMAMIIYFLHMGVLVVTAHFGETRVWVLVLLSAGLPALAGLVLLPFLRWFHARTSGTWLWRILGATPRDRQRRGLYTGD